ncbi:teaA receptor TeaR [Aspergillus terreus]|uniref:TeaA receptor TeaR n=1 Tax=Aspergillus terreus TaxID=33178 RepID=A0A5M3YWC7_ASPTE|nr:hypothetical protein ATETN484_0005023600 [Aspergillus terreus]GFF16901.1 teaA receptor TeaR [Aspergillus terreus]
MAGAATASYSADVWTSSGTVDATAPSQWDYAVPSTNRANRRSKSRSSYDSTHARSRRNSKGSRSSSLSRHAYAHESGYVNSRGRHDASLSRRGSERSVRSRSVGNVRDSVDTQNAPLRRGDMKDGIGVFLDESDSENWIHRDKLAKIESEELQQAAILFHRRGLENGRTSRRNHDLHNSAMSVTSARTEQTEPWPNLHEDHREFTGSPTPYDDDAPDERRNWDLRRPEEIAADVAEDNASHFYRNPGLRKSSSRIPIPTSSPAPMSPEHFGRESSGQRSRATTNEDDAMSTGKPRRASEPITVDSTDASTPPGSTSRPVSRGLQSHPTSKKTGARGTATRKTSAPPTTRKTTPRNRAVSGNGNQRPTTRSGETRPTTAVNRPEGDPPWLATMYKPDPRLPPEQQMLPTHAKKMQQEQWAREGKTPTAYDREFAPLAIGPDGPPRVEPKEEKKDDDAPAADEKPQPLPASPQPPTQPDSAKMAEPGTRPGTSSGYSPMPRLQEPPQAGLTPRWSPPVLPTIAFIFRRLFGSFAGPPRDLTMSVEKAQKIIDENAVAVFSKSYCPYCKASKDLLNSFDAKFTTVELDKESDGSAIQDALQEITGQRTVPNIFINKKHIGGNSDLQAKKNELEALLKEAGAI